MQKFASCAFLSLGLLAPLAHAADTDAPQSTLTVGAGIAVVSEYSGSDQQRTRAVVGVDYQNKNGFFASTMRGIGYQGKVGDFGFSAAIGYGAGRKDYDRNYGVGSDYLRGMGEIEGSTLALIGGSYKFGGVTVSTRAAVALTHRERGNQYALGLQVPLLKDEKNQVGMFTNADYSDRKHMQTFYGVTAKQSLASGFQAYTPKAGFSKVALGVNWNHQLSKAWSVNTTLGVNHLVGDAADSPLTQRKTSGFAISTVNYAF